MYRTNVNVEQRPGDLRATDAILKNQQYNKSNQNQIKCCASSAPPALSWSAPVVPEQVAAAGWSGQFVPMPGQRGQSVPRSGWSADHEGGAPG
jgi:hypothetical protein